MSTCIIRFLGHCQAQAGGCEEALCEYTDKISGSLSGPSRRM